MVSTTLETNVMYWIVCYFKKSITNNTFDASIELEETIYENIGPLSNYIVRLLKKYYGPDITSLFEYMYRSMRSYLRHTGVEDENGEIDHYSNREILTLFLLFIEERYRDNIRKKLENTYITDNEIVLK